MITYSYLETERMKRLKRRLQARYGSQVHLAKCDSDSGHPWVLAIGGKCAMETLVYGSVDPLVRALGLTEDALGHTPLYKPTRKIIYAHVFLARLEWLVSGIREDD